VRAWGTDAEQLLGAHPDLSIIRCRQLTELFVRTCEHRFQLVQRQGLASRLSGLRGYLPHFTLLDLGRVRSHGNAAVHVNSLAMPGPGMWSKKARQAVLVLAQAWCWYLDAEPPKRLRGLPGHDPLSERNQLSATLDEAERAIEVYRDTSAAEHLVDRVKGRLRGNGLTDDERDLMTLRMDSIELSAANYTGDATTHHGDGRSSRILAWGDHEAIDELVHFNNRRAVAHLNRLDHQGAIQLLEPFLDWRRAHEEWAPPSLSTVEMRDWQRGALLGTLGQAHAIRAHALEEPHGLATARDCFAEARSMFTEPNDIERQVVYRFEALCDLLRMKQKLTATEVAELEELIAQSPPPAWFEQDFHTSAFRIAVALKAARLLGVRPAWVARTAARLTDVPATTALQHPYERIAMGVGHFMAHTLPKVVRQRLTNTAAGQGLEAWLASTHLSTLQAAEPPSPPPILQDWWATNHIAKRWATDPTSILPFNWSA
jgi:hypothetical protein